MNPFRYFKSRKARLLEEQRRVALEAYDNATSRRKIFAGMALHSRKVGNFAQAREAEKFMRQATSDALRAEIQLRVFRGAQS